MKYFWVGTAAIIVMASCAESKMATSSNNSTANVPSYQQSNTTPNSSAKTQQAVRSGGAINMNEKKVLSGSTGRTVDFKQ